MEGLNKTDQLDDKNLEEKITNSFDVERMSKDINIPTSVLEEIVNDNDGFESHNYMSKYQELKRREEKNYEKQLEESISNSENLIEFYKKLNYLRLSFEQKGLPSSEEDSFSDKLSRIAKIAMERLQGFCRKDIESATTSKELLNIYNKYKLDMLEDDFNPISNDSMKRVINSDIYKDYWKKLENIFMKEIELASTKEDVKDLIEEAKEAQEGYTLWHKVKSPLLKKFASFY